VQRTIVLGGGFGGIACATALRRALGQRQDVLLVDRAADFMMGLRKLWAVVGSDSLEDGRRPRARLERLGVRFIHSEIHRIDAATRRVETDAGTLHADRLVIALGAEPRPDLVPGLAEHAHDVYDARAIPALAEAVARFDGGRILVLIAGGPYRCPPAPFECAMLLDAHLRERGVRDRTDLSLATFQPMLLPNAGRDGSAWLAAQLDERGIGHRTGVQVERVEAGRVACADGSVLEADLIIGVPPHRPPAVVKQSGLTGDGDWISVEPATLRTGHARVWAIGDCTQIPLANGLPLPKAGLFAEMEGERVAADIAADVLGTEPPPPFDGTGYCFIETGPDSATRVEGDFFATPEPRVSVADVSAANAEAKRAFERDRLRAWFG
jgi:sulfide:quinone oxidoreductase